MIDALLEITLFAAIKKYFYYRTYFSSCIDIYIYNNLSKYFKTAQGFSKDLLFQYFSMQKFTRTCDIYFPTRCFI